MKPTVTLNVLDGALGIVDPKNGDTILVMGTSSAGSPAIPTVCSKPSDATAFGKGDLVEGLSYLLKNYGKKVVALKLNVTTDGTYGAVNDDDIGGLCVVTSDSGTKPYGAFDVHVRFPSGGTVGASGITYQTSIDGGQTFGAITALGTATSITISEINAKFSLTSATIGADGFFTCRTVSPAPDSDDLAEGLAAIGSSNVSFDTVLLMGVSGSTEIQTLDTFCAAQFVAGKEKAAVCNLRRPNIDETETQYQTAVSGIVSSISSKWVNVCAGFAMVVSGVSGKSIPLPVALPVAGRTSITFVGQDACEIDLGALPGVRLRDENGNLYDETTTFGCIHDEDTTETLDDLRVTVLRSQPGYHGAYINNCRMLAPSGSDFIYWQFRRVMNAAATAVRPEVRRRLSKGIVLNKSGTILETYAKDIEVGANSKLGDALLSKPGASACKFTLSRVDNVLSTQKMTGTVRVVPLGYPKEIELEMGFDNPAIRNA